MWSHSGGIPTKGNSKFKDLVAEKRLVYSGDGGGGRQETSVTVTE